MVVLVKVSIFIQMQSTVTEPTGSHCQTAFVFRMPL